MSVTNHKRFYPQRNIFVSLFVFLVFLIGSIYSAPPALAAGETLPQPSADFYVNDQANLLTDATKTEILSKNAALNQAHGVQLVVYTVETLPGATYEERVAYLRSLLSGWQVGGAEGRGLLLALSVSDSDYLAVAGDGLKACFTTEALKTLLTGNLEADFSAKSYDAGVLKFFQAAAAQAEAYCAAGPAESAAGAQEANSAAQATARPAKKKSAGGSVLMWVGIAAGAVAVVSIAVFVLSGRGARRNSRYAVHRHRPLITPARTNVLRHETRPMVQIKSYRQSTGVYRNQKPARTSRNDRRQ